MPLEERKYKDINQFGEGDQAKVCVDIMQKTGAHLELSLAKDQGLSIMVSGKLDAVMKARKEIVSRLQTQVKAVFSFPFFSTFFFFFSTSVNLLDVNKRLHEYQHFILETTLTGFNNCGYSQGTPSFCHWQKWGKAPGTGTQNGYQNSDPKT